MQSITFTHSHNNQIVVGSIHIQKSNGTSALTRHHCFTTAYLMLHIHHDWKQGTTPAIMLLLVILQTSSHICAVWCKITDTSCMNNNNGIWIWLQTDVNRWDSRSTSTMTLITVNIQTYWYQLTHERICCCANWKIPQRAEQPVAPIRTCCMHEIAKLPQRHLFDTRLFQHSIQILKLNEEQKADNSSEILSTIDGNPRTNSKAWSEAEKLRVDHSWGEQIVILSHTEWHECEVRKYLYSCTWQTVPFYQSRRTWERKITGETFSDRQTNYYKFYYRRSNEESA